MRTFAASAIEIQQWPSPNIPIGLREEERKNFDWAWGTL
jgi:hypothetical protein